ncbi:MAG TPA: serine/threonine-protein kinase [Kofleriaceae bacterium]
MRTEQTQSSTGLTVGRYHLHRQIARGGMARIHIARSVGSEGFERLVAAKRLDPQLATDAELVDMFLAEARIASKIHHRNVVPVLDVVTIDGEVIMVQELVHGAPLHKLFGRAQLSNTRIPIEIAVSIAAQVLSGLQAAHDAVDETGMPLNIVHRDVSPQNVMIATDGTARLLDFGIAKSAAAAYVTQSGTFKGKLAYSSPEQLEGELVTCQTDVYALGIVLWELLVGDRMHAGQTEARVFATKAGKDPMPITQALAGQRREISDVVWRQLQTLEPIVQRALARNLEERYASAAEMERALVAAIDPAPLIEVAAWLRLLAQDMIDQTDQVIAAEEASWRHAKGSGTLPTVLPRGTEPRRASTSLETEAAKPSALARLWPAKTGTPGQPSDAKQRGVGRALSGCLVWLARITRVPAALLVDGLAISMLLLLVLAIASMPDERPAQLRSVTIELPQVQPPVACEAPVVTKKPAVKRRPVTRRHAKPSRVARSKTDCSIPFYFQGDKKIFKPSCI